MKTGYLILPDSRTVALEPLTSLGSDSNNTISLEGLGISPRHCRIELRENQFFIRDQRSHTGTRVNGTSVLEALLQDGDWIEIGSAEVLFSEALQKSSSGVSLKSKNESWQAQLDCLGPVAQTDFPILLLGASGTGKEVLAEEIHKNSTRAHGPFVRVNCCALTETLIESELFGHIKGSFTGAIQDRKGAFETARGGTLFLDEIGDLPYALQAKLLRALENNEIRPVGSDKTVKTDIRIVAATHQNLMERIQDSEFRADLYYRLNVISITPPTLAERPEDFDELLYYFAKQMRVRFSFDAIQKLKKHSWPGNIRELRNTVARASAYFPKTRIDETHLGRIMDSVSPSSGSSDKFGGTRETGTLPVIKEIEKQMILKRLAANQGNQRRTASDLGMPKSTLMIDSGTTKLIRGALPRFSRVSIPPVKILKLNCGFVKIEFRLG